MPTPPLSADVLLKAAALAVARELQPGLPSDQRYMAAMIVRALEIARREVLAEDKSAQWSLLDRVYDDGEGNPSRLAADIRSARVTEASHPGLGDAIRAIVLAELRITNPDALKTSSEAGDAR